MRIDRDKKMTQAEYDDMAALYGAHEPHFCRLFLDRRLSLQDNHEIDIVRRLELDHLWKSSRVFPHQVDACFSQNRRDGPAVKDYSTVWRQKKRDLNITAATLSMRLHVTMVGDMSAFDVDVPFHGDIDTAIGLVMEKVHVTHIKTCSVFIFYDGKLLLSVDILDRCQSHDQARRREEKYANIARDFNIDLETLEVLYGETLFNVGESALPDRNLHRHFDDNPRYLPNDGFRDPRSRLHALVDSGDLFWATRVEGKDSQGKHAIWRQDPTFTDQGAARWAAPLWEMLHWDLVEDGQRYGWKGHDMTRAQFFAAFGVPEESNA